MTDEQREFHSDIVDVSPTLADWVEAKFEAGFTIAEVKAYLREAGKVAGRS